VVPSHCTLHIAPVHDPDYVADRILFWHSVYGFSMTGMITGMHKEVNIRHHSPSTLAGSSSPFLQLPLHTITLSELTFDRTFECAIAEDSGGLDGFIIWFDTFFLPTREGSLPVDAKAEMWKGEGVAFTTGPAGKETHWQQASLFRDWEEGPRPALEKGGKVKGRVGYKKRVHNSRELGIDVEWEIVGSDGKTVEWGKQLWTL
jgi:type I protein arginine methyltransferase